MIFQVYANPMAPEMFGGDGTMRLQLVKRRFRIIIAVPVSLFVRSLIALDYFANVSSNVQAT
jgi:hypothetical protein